MKRRFLLMMAVLLLQALTTALSAQTLQTTAWRYKVAACDWMMLKRQKLGEFKLAQEIGADGVEVDMGSLGKRVLFDNQLRDSTQAGKFRHAAVRYGVEVPSMAMSGFFAQSFLERDNYLDLLADCFRTMKVFGCKVAFLPLGGSGKAWKEEGAARDTMVSRLREAGRLAEKEHIIIGVRTGMSAKADKRLLRDVGSKHVKVYFSVQDALDNQRDVCSELKTLGAKRIVQIHITNTDGHCLPDDPAVDLPAIRRTLDKMKWTGWLVVERSRDKTRVRDVKHNFSTNVAYIKKVFECK